MALIRYMCNIKLTLTSAQHSKGILQNPAESCRILQSFPPVVRNNLGNSMKTFVGLLVRSIKSNAKHQHNESLSGSLRRGKSLPSLHLHFFFLLHCRDVTSAAGGP